MLLFLIIGLIVVIGAVILLANTEEQSVSESKEEAGSPEWEYGDVWRRGSPDGPVPQDDVEYVEILRGDTGMGYDDTSLIDLVGYLSSRGVRATYDAVPLAMEFGGAIKTYVLKVEIGKEDEALQYLREKETGTG